MTTEPHEKPQTIREYLASCPSKAGQAPIMAACEKHGISLDSPWPPQFPKDETALAKSPASARLFQFPLPLDDEQTRAASNTFARSAIFAAVKERQKFSEWTEVATSGKERVEIMGQQLNQDDHDTFLELVMIAARARKPHGEAVAVSVNEVLRSLGRSTHQEQRRQLFEQIERLVTTSLKITSAAKPTYRGHLLDDAATPEDMKIEPRLRRHLAFRVNPVFSKLFEASYTFFDKDERQKLTGRGSELAKWLHTWIIGNAEQYPHSVEKLRELSGSRIKELKHFREKLRQALSLLQGAGIITGWKIDERDLVHIERMPSAAQQKHLAKKARKPRRK